MCPVQIACRRSPDVNTGAQELAVGTSALSASGAPWLPVRAVLTRAALERRLDDGACHRLTTLVAGAGYGKTTLLAAWSDARQGAWYTVTERDRDIRAFAGGLVDAIRARVPTVDPGVALDGLGIEGEGRDPSANLAGVLSVALSEALDEELVLVVDDVHELAPAGSSARFLGDLCRQAPEPLRLVLSSRADPPFPIARLRAQGEVVDIAADELAFGPEEVGALFAELAGDDAGNVAERLHAATGGWPAAVRLGVEALRVAPPERRDRVLHTLTGPNSPVILWLTEEVLAAEAPEVTDLVQRLAPFDRFTGPLAETLGVPGARHLVPSLARRGLLVVTASEEGWFALHPLLREFASERLPLEAEEVADLERRAAAWLEDQGRPRDALHCLRRARDWEGVARLLVEHAPAVLASGGTGELVDAADDLPEEWRTDAVVVIEADARIARGDYDGALACFDRLLPPAGPIPAARAWRAALAHHLLGRVDDALALCQRADADDAVPVDRAMLLAGESVLRQAEISDSRRLAEKAVAAARTAHNDEALAAAHAAFATVSHLEGKAVESFAEFERARVHAERAAAVVKLGEIHTGVALLHIEGGDYRQALVELDEAVRLADFAGIASFRSRSLTIRAWTLLLLGRNEEGVADVEAARRQAKQLGSADIAHALTILGGLHRRRGHMARARAAYEEAVRVTEPSGHHFALPFVLAGLARVIVGSEPERAKMLAEQALSYTVPFRQRILLDVARVAIELGDLMLATTCATEAIEEARTRGDMASLARALMVRAEVTSDRASVRADLEEASGIWNSLAVPLGEARVDLAVARLARDAGDADTARARAAGAEPTLRELGSRREATEAASLLADLDHQSPPPVEVKTLGRFTVVIGGRPVSASAWQSRKARDLLKVLVARRGRPVHREALVELLWPDDDASRGSSRLSVALSTLRSVLDPDKRHQPDDLVASDRETIRLCLDRVGVDVEEFFENADVGLGMQAEGRFTTAREHLVAAERAYEGDFLEEDAFDDWAVAPREEARTSYVVVARALAEGAAAASDYDAAVRYFLRILERDPYDEQAHLGLVRAFAGAGRHGEARRAYRGYCARMDELGVEPAVFPAPGRVAV
jgi:ATP/maltotriose-dependent transcriptional regulator MalT/DNA-binding SARP family transcriptional activator